MRTSIACLILCAWPFFAFPQQEFKLLASDGAASDEFGSSVAVSGDVMIVGAPKNNNAAVTCGTAYVYRKTGSTWTQEQILSALDAGTDDQFGISVDIFDNVAVVGAHFDDDNGTNAGAVYVYRNNGSIWVQEDKLIALDGNAGDEFGRSVAVYDSVIVVGAYRANLGSTGNGAAYVFKYNGINWTQTQKLNAIAPQIDDFFGYSVDIHKDRIIAGTYQDDDNGVNSGSAYIFNFNGTLWQQEQKIIPSNGTAGDLFGFSVSVNDSTALIGAYGKNTGFPGSGAAYVFTRQGSIWTENQQLTAPGAQQDDWFGYDVKISGRTIIAGAFHDDDLGPESGAVYLYRYDGSNWIYEFTMRAGDGNTNDFYGIRTDLDGNEIIIGAPNNDDNGANSGSAYAYSLCTYRPVQELCLSTVNSNFAENLLIWSKPTTTFIDSFFVYRFDGISDVLIGKRGYDEASEFTDNTANVNGNSYRYRLSTINHCGTESDPGTYHKTIHLIASHSGTGQVQLNWDDQQGFAFPYYRIWRDTTGTGAFHLIFATLNTQFSYTDNALPQGNDLRYYIEVQRTAGSCNSGVTSRATAISNLSDPNTSTTSELHPESFNIYPNPADQLLIVDVIQGNENELQSLELLDLGGKVVYSTNLKYGENKIPLSGLIPGYYLARLSGKYVTVKPLLIIR